jgi:O-antigen biosynthesis protein
MVACLRSLILIISTLLLLPFLFLLAAAILILNFIRFWVDFTRTPMPCRESPVSGLASIVILNWNGIELLRQGIPSVVEAVRTDGKEHEILVVDNGSDDGSVEFLSENYPEIRVLTLGENLGFARGNNAGVKAAKHDVVVLLNNDMVVERSFLRPLLEGFGSATFAVASQVCFQDPSARREETGKTTACFRRGMIDYSHRPLEDSTMMRPYYPVFWAGGGSSAYHKGRFLDLGGFREIYSPAYVEDTDLSYRAWKAGWEVLFTPRSVVHHKHRASSRRRFRARDLQNLIHRNQFLFIWTNIRSWKLLLSHCLCLPWNCYRLARDFGLSAWKSLFQGAMRLLSAKNSLFGSRYLPVRCDGEIFEIFEKPGLYLSEKRPARQALSDFRPRVLWMTAYLPYLGKHAGAGRMFHLLKRLSQDYRITLLTFLEFDDEMEFLPQAEALCERVIAMRRTPPLRWQLFPYEPFEEFRTPQMQAALDHCLEESDFDLLQFEYAQMACYASKRFGIPSLVTKHEVDFFACGRKARVETSLAKKVLWFYRYLQVLDREIKLAQDVDAIVCVTDDDARQFRKFCNSTPIHVINTGVDLEYFSPPASSASQPRLVFVGAFQHEPNVDAMLYFCRKILPLVRREIPESDLVIVGSNPTPAIASLGEIPGVRVTGFVPDIRPYMASSAVYIVPLRLGAGIRGKILEAWAMGMPVVASSVACAGLANEDGKNLLRADSEELFADHVVALLRDPELRARLGSEGRKTAEARYGWESSAAKLDALYRHLMSVNAEARTKWHASANRTL